MVDEQPAEPLAHPEFGKPLGGKMEAAGIKFRAYRSGISRYVWFSHNLRVKIDDVRFKNGNLSGYAVWLDGVAIPRPKRGFRSMYAAARAAIAKATGEQS